MRKTKRAKTCKIRDNSETPTVFVYRGIRFTVTPYKMGIVGYAVHTRTSSKKRVGVMKLCYSFQFGLVDDAIQQNGFTLQKCKTKNAAVAKLRRFVDMSFDLVGVARFDGTYDEWINVWVWEVKGGKKEEFLNKFAAWIPEEFTSVLLASITKLWPDVKTLIEQGKGEKT